MIPGIDNKSNKQRIALVVVGYNRLEGLKRVLDSLNSAFYKKEDNIPLVISIDCSGNEEVYSFVRQYKWSHGDKYVNIQESRLGLKAHIIQCGDLTRYFRAIALFEDDLWVSPYFYSYLNESVEKYGEDENICQIALYKNERLGRNGFYFDVLHNGTDCFLWQDICTWGECWTEKMWVGFKTWLSEHDDNYVNQVDIPDYAKKWTRAWSKYYMAYEVDTKKYVLFPYESLTTNFNDDGGEHGGAGSGGNLVQVNVLFGSRKYNYPLFENMVRYDIFANNEKIVEWLPEKYRNNVCLDLYGYRSAYQDKRYVLSMRQLPYKVVEKWGLAMRPVELNIYYSIKGEGILLYDTNIKEKRRSSKIHFFTRPTVGYFTRRIDLSLLLGYVINSYKDKVKRKLRSILKK